MNQALAAVAVNAAFCLFISGVLRGVMNEMDEVAFQAFIESLVRHSTHSSFMIIVLNSPLIGAVPYYYFFGFRNG